MTDITNPQAVTFISEFVRTSAGELANLYKRACDVLARWNALGGSTMVPNTSDRVIDPAMMQGHPEITGIMANNVMNRLSDFKTDYEANSSAKLNTVLQVAPFER